MSKISENGKFLHIEDVKVYFNHKENTIQIISNDKDLTGKPFQVTLKQGTPSEATLRELLIEKQVIKPEVSKPVTNIPKFVPYPPVKKKLFGKNPVDNSNWNLIPLGVGVKSVPIVWDVLTSSNALLAGHSGSGKSVFQRNIILHCLRNPDEWVFFGVEPWGFDLKPYENFNKTVSGVGVEIEESLEVLKKVNKILQERTLLMKNSGVTNFKLIPTDDNKPLPSVMLLVDEIHGLFNQTKVKNEEDKVLNKLRQEALSIVTEIASKGHIVGIHLVVSTQAPEEGILSDELDKNLGTRIMLGRSASSVSEKVLGSPTIANHIPEHIHGRCIASPIGLLVDGTKTHEYVQFQTYYTKFGLNEETLNLSKTD